MSTDSEIGEVVARVRRRSLAVCDNCGGEGYTDMGRSACADCYGAGVMTPELAARLRSEAPPDDRGLCECRIGQCRALTERCREVEK